MRLCVLALVSALFLGITPTSFAADTSAPVLVDWKLLDLKTDISTSDGKWRIEFSISDESRIEEPLSSLSSQSTTQQSGFAFPIFSLTMDSIISHQTEL